MPARADVVVRVDASRSVVVVSGAAPEALVPELGDVLRRAAESVGPHMRVDLTACDVVAPAVLGLLRAERTRLVARGGSLSCDGADLDGADLDGSGLDGAGLDGADLDGPDLDGAGPHVAGQDGSGPDGGPPPEDRLASPSESALRLAAAVRRRTAAEDVGPERSAAGDDLLALLGVTRLERPT